MHQLPRPAPRSASAASNPSTNPERTNNPRDTAPARTRSSVDLASYTERAGRGAGGDNGGESARGDENVAGQGQDRETTKLNQIIQHFHSKAALMICSSRASLPQVRMRNGDIKQNRWFNIVLDETDLLLDNLQEWKRPDLSTDKPPPLIIEVFIDTSGISNNQSLVLVDDQGKRWDTSETLASSTRTSPHTGERSPEVVIERWTVSLGDASNFSTAELNDLLPNVYKKGVVLFRSLFTLLRYLPSWKLYRRLGRQTSTQQPLRIKFRIRRGHQHDLARDPADSLFTPLCQSQQRAAIVEQHTFEPLLCPVGPLSIGVEYRINTDFNVAETETLLSSRFLNIDEGLPAPVFAGRSLPGPRTQGVTHARTSTTAREPRGLLGAYGSLGTFHGTEKRPSPVTLLRQRVQEDEEDEMQRDRDVKGGSGRSSLDLIANPPFKAGSVASTSPRFASYLRAPPSPASGSGSNSGIVSKTPRVQTAVRPSLPSRTAEGGTDGKSGTSTPGGVSRYSSSFANRPRRATTTSGKGDSSEGSGQKSGQSPAASSGAGSGITDGDNEISDFISQLNRVKLSSPQSASGESVKRGSRGDAFCIDLSQYKGLRDGSTALAEEMSSSSFLHPGSNITPPSRRLSNVPGLSTSSSPSRALAHTPHVRSRLSTHSIAEEVTAAASAGSAEGGESPSIADVEEEEEDEPFIFPHHNDDYV